MPLRAVPGSLHGPETVSWRVNQSAIVLLGGPRALLLQLAEPAVAAGVAEHSGFEADPFGRLARTLDAMTAISFGPPELARTTLLGLGAVHARVKGTLPGGAAYSASDPELQWWVLSTLIDTALRVECRYAGRLTVDERQRYYQESLLLADAFGVPRRLIPGDLGAFQSWMRGRTATLEVTDVARRLAASVLHPPVPLLPPPVFDVITTVTADLLPARLRAAYGLRLDRPRRFVLEAAQAGTRAVLPKLPALIRDLPSRISGDTPGPPASRGTTQR
jgi:uncharacterized protein (DUF2236 family)